MSYYNKFITYIELYEQDEKIKGIGFVRSKITDEVWELAIHIKGLAKTDTLLCEMKDSKTGKAIDRFRLKEGSGDYTFSYSTEELLQKGLSFFEMEGLRFGISAARYGLCIWGTKEQDEKTVISEPIKELDFAAAEIPQEEEKKREVREEKLQKTEKEEIREKTDKEEMNKEEMDKEEMDKEEIDKEEIERTEKKLQKAKRNKAELKEPKQRKIEAQEIKVQEIEKQEAAAEKVESQETISSDKWEQLCRMYPLVHPFTEEEKGEFLSITPKEFVILSEGYQSLANNSFLLHGFFNYRHILLGRTRVEKEMKYYIGVPGIYHEREKRVAVMFGFEAFEAMESENQGAFGYYMKTVRI